MQVMLPLFGGLGSVALFAGNRNPLMIVAGGVMLGAMVIGGLMMFISQRTGARRKAITARARYMKFLEELGDERIKDGVEQRQIATIRHPAPEQLQDLIRDPRRLWERRRHDPDFLVVRLGVGHELLRRPIVMPSGAHNPMTQPDPLAQAALDRVRDRTGTLDNMPMAVPLIGSVSLVGPPAVTRVVLRAMLLQVATLHAPDDVRICLCAGRHDRSEFEVYKWLPHLLDVEAFDGPVARRLVATTTDELAELLKPELTRRSEFAANRRRAGGSSRVTPTPRLLIVADQLTAHGATPLNLLPDNMSAEELGLTVVTIVDQRQHEPGHVDVRVSCTADGQLKIEDLRPPAQRSQSDEAVHIGRIVAGASEGTTDFVPPHQATFIARQLAPLRLVEDAELETPLEATIDLAKLVGVDDVGTYDSKSLWAPRPLPQFLRVPFGLDGAGQKVYVDLKEAAQNGMGPHGLCVGATGSGKSEVLRTLVLTLAMTHPPDRLSLVLVDYKGGATFAGLEQLPHTTAMVSNLSDDSGLVDRLRDAIEGEINRRQQLLLQAGALPNTTVYNDRRSAGQQLAPLPNLFVVIDEFGEMLTAKPDFIELFLQIGRIGRSIGVHLLLASQRLEEGRLRGLESYLSYRLGLKTFNSQESRTVLGVPDAFELPSLPGSGYLKVDSTMERFKAAYVSGTYRPASADQAPTQIPPIPMPYPLLNRTAQWIDQVTRQDKTSSTSIAEDRFAPTTLDIVVGRLAGSARQVQQIWLPPLPTALPLNALLGELVREPASGLTVADPQRRGTLRIPVALLDKPAEQWQGAFELDLSGGNGNVAIMGAPQSGKSTALRTAICAAALTHTPSELAFYGLDFGGGGLSALAGLPHVGGTASRLDPNRVRRTIAEVVSELIDREQVFAEHRLDSVDAMRAAHRAGRLPELPVADVVLVIDNWTVLKEDFEDLIEDVQEVANRGLGFGVHLIVTTGRWADLRSPMQSVIGTKIELRLNDATDTTNSKNRKALDNIKPEARGRCVVSPGLTAQLCLARIDHSDDPGTVQEGVDDLVKQVNGAWVGSRAPEIRMLPTEVNYLDIRASHPHDAAVLLGIDEADLLPVRLDLFGIDQHLVVFGDSESGKTNLARLIVHELVGHYSDDQVVFAVFDLRRTLLDAVPEPYRGAYAGTTSVAAGLAVGMANEELKARLPPDTVTPTELRQRSWWKGPEIVILADDYDLLNPSGAGPLAPFLEYLPQARDIGLHLVLLHRAGGAGRAIHQPVIQRLKELGATGLLLSGDRQEGQLWPGVHLSIQPPGRGLLVRRGRKPVPLQIALMPNE